MALDLFKIALSSIKMEVGSIRTYIEDNAMYIEGVQLEVSQSYARNQRLSASDEEQDEIDSHFEGLYYTYHREFPAFSFNSLLVTQFSLLETKMKFLCEIFERDEFSKVKLSDLKGSEFETCWRYFTKVADLNMNDVQNLWSKLKTVQKLRNAIVHNSARIPSSDSESLSFIKKDSRIKLEEDHFFFIQDAEFLIDLGDEILQFLTKMSEKLSARRVVLLASKS